MLTNLERGMVDQYAAAEGFALKTFFLDCIRRGNRMDIEEQMASARIQEQMKNVFQGNQEALELGLTLSWGQYVRAAVEGGVDEETASEYFIKNLYLARQASSIDALLDLNQKLLLGLVDAVIDAQKEYGNQMIVIHCRDMIKNRIYEKITVQDIADHLHFSRAYLSKCFKKATGETVQQFIQHEKIAEAKRLLRSTSMSVVEVGNRLGFCSQSYFTAVFRQICGETPSEYRNLVWQNE